MKTDWKAIIAIPVCFWLGHVLQIAFQDQQGLAKKNGDLRIRVDRDKQGFREELQRQSGAFLTKISSLKETNAGDKSRIDELDKQVQSQRNTIDNFGSQLIKAVAKPLIVTPLVFDKNGDNAVHKRLRWIVLTNQAAGAQKVRIVCSAPIKVESITVLGGGGLGYLPQKVTANMWDQNLGSPWTPTTPLLVEMSYGAGVTDDFACSFTPR